jgi:hypothetical protein
VFKLNYKFLFNYSEFAGDAILQRDRPLQAQILHLRECQELFRELQQHLPEDCHCLLFKDGLPNSNGSASSWCLRSTPVQTQVIFTQKKKKNQSELFNANSFSGPSSLVLSLGWNCLTFPRSLTLGHF